MSSDTLPSSDHVDPDGTSLAEVPTQRDGHASPAAPPAAPSAAPSLGVTEHDGSADASAAFPFPAVPEFAGPATVPLLAGVPVVEIQDDDLPPLTIGIPGLADVIPLAEVPSAQVEDVYTRVEGMDVPLLAADATVVVVDPPVEEVYEPFTGMAIPLLVPDERPLLQTMRLPEPVEELVDEPVLDEVVAEEPAPVPPFVPAEPAYLLPEFAAQPVQQPSWEQPAQPEPQPEVWVDPLHALVAEHAVPHVDVARAASDTPAAPWIPDGLMAPDIASAVDVARMWAEGDDPRTVLPASRPRRRLFGRG